MHILQYSWELIFHFPVPHVISDVLVSGVRTASSCHKDFMKDRSDGKNIERVLAPIS